MKGLEYDWDYFVMIGATMKNWVFEFEVILILIF
jgi:hypothetical protein